MAGGPLTVGLEWGQEWFRGGRSGDGQVGKPTGVLGHHLPVRRPSGDYALSKDKTQRGTSNVISIRHASISAHQRPHYTDQFSGAPYRSA